VGVDGAPAAFTSFLEDFLPLISPDAVLVSGDLTDGADDMTTRYYSAILSKESQYTLDGDTPKSDDESVTVPAGWSEYRSELLSHGLLSPSYTLDVRGALDSTRLTGVDSDCNYYCAYSASSIRASHCRTYSGEDTEDEESVIDTAGDWGSHPLASVSYPSPTEYQALIASADTSLDTDEYDSLFAHSLTRLDHRALEMEGGWVGSEASDRLLPLFLEVPYSGTGIGAEGIDTIRYQILGVDNSPYPGMAPGLSTMPVMAPVLLESTHDVLSHMGDGTGVPSSTLAIPPVTVSPHGIGALANPSDLADILHTHKVPLHLSAATVLGQVSRWGPCLSVATVSASSSSFARTTLVAFDGPLLGVTSIRLDEDTLSKPIVTVISPMEASVVSFDYQRRAQFELVPYTPDEGEGEGVDEDNPSFVTALHIRVLVHSSDHISSVEYGLDGGLFGDVTYTPLDYAGDRAQRTLTAPEVAEDPPGVGPSSDTGSYLYQGMWADYPASDGTHTLVLRVNVTSVVPDTESATCLTEGEGEGTGECSKSVVVSHEYSHDFTTLSNTPSPVNSLDTTWFGMVSGSIHPGQTYRLIYFVCVGFSLVTIVIPRLLWVPYLRSSAEISAVYATSLDTNAQEVRYSLADTEKGFRAYHLARYRYQYAKMYVLCAEHLHRTMLTKGDQLTFALLERGRIEKRKKKRRRQRKQTRERERELEAASKTLPRTLSRTRSASEISLGLDKGDIDSIDLAPSTNMSRFFLSSESTGAEPQCLHTFSVSAAQQPLRQRLKCFTDPDYNPYGSEPSLRHVLWDLPPVRWLEDKAVLFMCRRMGTPMPLVFVCLVLPFCPHLIGSVAAGSGWAKPGIAALGDAEYAPLGVTYFLGCLVYMLAIFPIDSYSLISGRFLLATPPDLWLSSRAEQVSDILFPRGRFTSTFPEAMDRERRRERPRPIDVRQHISAEPERERKTHSRKGSSVATSFDRSDAASETDGASANALLRPTRTEDELMVTPNPTLASVKSQWVRYRKLSPSRISREFIGVVHIFIALLGCVMLCVESESSAGTQGLLISPIALPLTLLLALSVVGRVRSGRQ
ncbi:hypothetical protein KIPB_000145, partial [Kipferlia bialata]